MKITVTEPLTVILLILSLLVGSCAPKTETSTRTATPLSESDKSSIKNVAIHVQVNEELNVDISKMRYWTNNFVRKHCDFECILLSPVIVTAGIFEELIRSNMDNKKAEEFRENVSDMKIDNIMSERIDEYFEITDTPFDAEISEIQSPSLLAQQGFDTMLDIKIEKLDIKLCPKSYVAGYTKGGVGVGPQSSDEVEYMNAILRWNTIYLDYLKKTEKVNDFLYSADASLLKKEAEEIDTLTEEREMLRPVIEEYASDSVRVWITFTGEIISTANGRVLWDREELYYDPKCETVKYMQKNPEIMVDMLARSIHGIAVNTVNEIQ